MNTRRCLALLASSLLALLLVALSPPATGAGPAKLEERVVAQRAIEEIYWRHRIWPQENPGPKPPLSAVLSDEAIRAKVVDYLKKSNALALLWGRPITAGQLQAELNRMSRDTRDAELLSDLTSIWRERRTRVAMELPEMARPARVRRGPPAGNNPYSQHFHE